MHLTKIYAYFKEILFSFNHELLIKSLNGMSYLTTEKNKAYIIRFFNV